MKTTKLLCIIMLVLIVSVCVFAEESRRIYVGDIITLKIASKDFSADELREKFRDYEILEIKDEPDGYLISIRTFEVGERIIRLGNKEIIITVNSILEDIQREDIFEGDKRVVEAGPIFYWRLLFYIMTGIFAISCCFIFVRSLVRRKIKVKSFYQLFLQHCKSLSDENYNYFVDLTHYFKKYLESIYQCRIVGKTSSEITEELSGISQLNSVLPDIREWLTECDRLKFTGIEVQSEEKRRHYESLLDIAGKINAKQVNEGTS